MIKKIFYHKNTCNFCGCIFYKSKFYKPRLFFNTNRIKSKITFKFDICAQCKNELYDKYLILHNELLKSDCYCSLDELKYLNSEYKCPKCRYNKLVMKEINPNVVLICTSCNVEYHQEKNEKGEIIRCRKNYR